MFVYATEINGGKGAKVSQVSGFELEVELLSRLSHALESVC